MKKIIFSLALITLTSCSFGAKDDSNSATPPHEPTQTSEEVKKSLEQNSTGSIEPVTETNTGETDTGTNIAKSGSTNTSSDTKEDTTNTEKTTETKSSEKTESTKSGTGTYDKDTQEIMNDLDALFREIEASGSAGDK